MQIRSLRQGRRGGHGGGLHGLNLENRAPVFCTPSTSEVPGWKPPPTGPSVYPPCSAAPSRPGLLHCSSSAPLPPPRWLVGLDPTSHLLRSPPSPSLLNPSGRPLLVPDPLSALLNGPSLPLAPAALGETLKLLPGHGILGLAAPDRGPSLQRRAVTPTGWCCGRGCRWLQGRHGDLSVPGVHVILTTAV